jgi:hypothetical protein
LKENIPGATAKTFDGRFPVVHRGDHHIPIFGNRGVSNEHHITVFDLREHAVPFDPQGEIGAFGDGFIHREIIFHFRDGFKGYPRRDSAQNGETKIIFHAFLGVDNEAPGAVRRSVKDALFFQGRQVVLNRAGKNVKMSGDFPYRGG